MNRFVAFLWDQMREDLAQMVQRWSDALQAESPRWTVVFDRPGLRIAVLSRRDGKVPIAPIGAADGVIIGQLFERGQERAGPLSRLTSQCASRLRVTKGGELVQNYWGAYVALWREDDSGAVQVVRDPCGATACFQTHAHGIELLCSYVDDIVDLPGIRFSVDWDAVRAFLLHNHFVTPCTGLNELREILPGERMTWRPGSETQFAWLWNAAAIAAEPTRQSFADACAELRATAEACFTAWSKTGSGIIVRLSGGLDSSIVAALMKRLGANRIFGLHLVGQGYEAFELKLARLAARHAGLDLLELELDSAAIGFQSLVDAPRLARPTRQLLGAAADALLTEACEALGADSVMGGHGGDSLFLQRSIAGDAFADYVKINGFGRDFWRTAYESAMLLERSVWRGLADAGAFASGLRKWSSLAFLEEASVRRHGILAPPGRTPVPPGYISHAWLRDAERLPPCKAEQVRSIVALRNYHPVVGHGVERDAVHPFISQPVVEFSLRTPAYMFSHGGTDRALERSAFADVIPGEITRRTHKGFVNHQLTQHIAGDAGVLREFVQEGHLVAQGGVERASVERLFTDENLARSDSLEPILNLVVAESWLAAWRR